MIKKGDFIELDYVGRVKETGDIFDITNVDAAKKYHVHNPRAQYGSRIICVGENALVRGVDAFLEGKECKEYTLTLSAKDAFGKKDAKLLKLVPASAFKKQNIRPVPGLQIDVDGYMGTVRSVSGGRIIIDFNHPLAGRNVIYELSIKRIITDDQEKLQSLVTLFFGRTCTFTFDHGNVTLPLALPEELTKPVVTTIHRLIPGIREIHFQQPPAGKKAVPEAPSNKTGTQA